MARKSLPKKLKVGRKKYKTQHVDPTKNVSALINEEALMGECDFSKQVITIFGNQPPLDMIDTVIHECLHAMIAEKGFKFKNRKEEEKYVERFTEIMVHLFKDNPDLLDYLKGQLHET